MYRHEAERLEQKAKGALERQKITDEAEAEKSRKELLELQANSAAVESTGQAKAEAQSHAEAARIEGEAAVEQARLKSQASKIEAVSYCKQESYIFVGSALAPKPLCVFFPASRSTHSSLTANNKCVCVVLIHSGWLNL